MHPVCTLIGDVLRELVTAKYDQNIRKAAKYLEVEYGLVYRLLAGQQKTLDFFTALNLVKVTGMSADGSLLREYYPSEFQDIEALGSVPNEYNEILAGLEFAVEVPLRYEVLLFVSEIKNVTKAQVEQEFGARGLISLAELVEIKLVMLNESGSISSLYSQDLWGSNDVCKKVLNANAGILRLDAPGSFIRNHSLALNKKGLIRYYKAHREFALNLSDIESDADLKGRNVIVSGLFMGPTSPKDQGETNEN